jgi:outer membrane biosynthesis protein TonB
MTTSEFILGHSADDLEERRQEARKIVWALLAALALHLVIGFAIALSSGFLSSPIQLDEDKPVELTLVDLPTPAPVPKNSMFMETDESKASVEKPKEQTFESNANSIGASELPATGSLPIPSQEGKDRPQVDLETHAYSVASAGVQPQPSVQPQDSPSPSVAPTPQPTPADLDQLAMLRATPTPSVQPRTAATPQPPRSIYQPFKERTRLSGGITNRGAARVNAIGTPLGRYQKIVQDAVGSHWHAYTEEKRDLINIGTLRLSFRIDLSGHPQNVKIISNTSNEAFANVCLQSVIEAQFPPIPEDVASSLPPEGLQFDDFTFIIYPN